MTVEVLLVDEDEEVLEITETFLQRADADLSVTTADSAGAALDAIESNGYDAVVSDYTMPELSGVELAAELTDRGVDLPFFLFTAREGTDLDEDLDAAGVTAVVQKGTGTEQYDELAALIAETV